MRAFLTLPTLLLAAAPAFSEDPLVVLAAARAGRIEIFDASLGPLASIGVNQQVESVTASSDGRRLYIAQESQRNSGACCGLRSEEHTSELQSLRHLVCRLLLEKKKIKKHHSPTRPRPRRIDRQLPTCSYR